MKRLILCCDGTWNSADQEVDGKPCPTNVIKLAIRLAKRDGAVSQIFYYDQGVGTGNEVDKLRGGVFGEGLEDNIHDAYRFLIGNYEAGDEIYLFGFSRGAFTARSIAGMVRKCGILKRETSMYYHEALELYRSADSADAQAPLAFRKANSLMGDQPTPVKFIGVWDTVGALGIPLHGLEWLTDKKYQFHDTTLSGSVKFAYHALAIDEHRSPFKPTLWSGPPKAGQTMEQVWFCGVHSDVGGGYADNGPSDIPLQWMMDKAQGAGLVFDPPVLAALPLHPDPQGKLHNSKTALYFADPGIDRRIGFDEASGQPDPTQSLHPSVLTRWDAGNTYRPQNLRAYFKAINDARGNNP